MIPTLPRPFALALTAATLLACSNGSEPPPPSYGHVPPPLEAVPPALAGDTWVTHWVDDIRPYWTAAEALGEPLGNFPTWRGMDGSLQYSTDRRPRMISRQVFAYSAGYLMTGDELLLEYARAGVDWLLTHARDETNGGWHPLLDVTGAAKPSGEPRTAQDAAYCGLGLAAYFFVTRDPAVEAELLAVRDLLFDPTRYWDESSQRIRDALTTDLGAEVDLEGDGGWELVAQLDPVNAFLLLTQPVLTDAGRREQFLDDMRRLAETMTRRFLADGIFWGVSSRQGDYGGKHVDFGHTLKAYWMVLQIDKRLPGHPFYDVATRQARAMLERAYDAPNGRWAKAPTSATSVEYGSDWWAYAEADQLAASLSLIDYRYRDELAETARHWLSDYVDDTRAVREVVPSIRRDGSSYRWPDDDTAKCNQWKNGYHSSEHALVLYVLGKALEGLPATLHFAVPAAIAESFGATPYVYQGVEVERVVNGRVTVGDSELTEVEVSFERVY